MYNGGLDMWDAMMVLVLWLFEGACVLTTVSPTSGVPVQETPTRRLGGHPSLCETRSMSGYKVGLLCGTPKNGTIWGP